VNVAYDDLEQIDPEDLLSSSLKITSTVVLKTGGTVTLPEIYIPPEIEDAELTETFLTESDQNLLKDSLYGKRSFKAGAFGNTYYNLNNTDYFHGNEAWLLNARYRSILAKEIYIKKQEFGDFRETGIFTFTLEIPKDAASLTVNAVYTDGEGTTAGAKLDGIQNYHPNERHLHVTSSTKNGVIGEYAVFHVRTNFPLLKFHYVVLSKGVLVHSASEEVPFAGAEGVATLALAISREMFPLMTFLAYHIDPNGDINADFIKIPIDSPSVFEPIPRTVSKVAIQPRNRAAPYSVKLKTSGDTEGDVRRTFQAAGLSPLSDTRFQSSSPNIGNCEVSLGLLECGDGTCYQVKDICNGVNNCEDGSDEILCNYQYVPTRSNEEGIDEVKVYHLLRQSWWKDLFDTEDGSFAWATQFIDHGGNEQLGLEIPRTQDDWVVEGIAFHQHFGISFIEPQMFNSNPPVFLVLEGPTICRRGEQVSIRTAVFNSMPFRQAVLLVVPESEDYQFVYVEEKGIVDFFKPRLSTGEHQHFLPVPPDSIREVFLPFAIKKQVGTVEIVIKMRSPVAWDEESWEIEVKPEGAPVMKHTSVLLDLKSRAVFYEFLNIPIDESPIIKNSLLRRFVAGSPQASLSISGDVFGPTPEEISIHYDDAFKGRRGLKSTDGLAFNFGATLWTLHYMRLTNQLTISEATGAFDFLNVQMAGILTRMINGGFKMWHYSGPSVWLTAWVTNLFQNAMFEEWENLIYVDPRVLSDSVNFLLKYQNPNGDFRETEHYNITLDYKYRYQKSSYPKDVSVGLTALVTATMKEVVDSLHGKIRKKANQAIGKAQRFLEKSLSSMDDPYDIAITAWALNMIGSTEKRRCCFKIVANSQTSRNFLQPKEAQEWDASSIEATSYALLVLLSQEGVTVREERIVNWLVSVRDWDFAFDATVDSIIAFRALTEYCYRARLRDVTDLKVNIETSSDQTFREQIRIEQPFVSAMQAIEIPNAWGHVLLTGRGAGQALAQLTTTWGVDVSERLEKPPRQYFTLYISEYHHQARNKSRITTTVCTQWTATDFSSTSHAAMVEVEVPTGYFLVQTEANQVARKAIEDGTFPQMKDVLCTEAYIFFQFSHVKRFEQIILNTTTLSALDVCEVCGSYQCPYCPFYSSSNVFRTSFILMVLSFIVAQNFVFSYDTVLLPLSLIYDMFNRRIS
ncbi:Antigen, partial [Armadillidium nasatum]